MKLTNTMHLLAKHVHIYIFCGNINRYRHFRGKPGSRHQNYKHVPLWPSNSFETLSPHKDLEDSEVVCGDYSLH